MSGLFSERFLFELGFTSVMTGAAAFYVVPGAETGLAFILITALTGGIMFLSKWLADLFGLN